MTQEHELHPAKHHGWITSYSGRRIVSTSVHPTDICKQDCTRGLAMQTRYLGQIRDFYSIAEHSILVSRISEHFGDDLEEIQASFQHDGHEYITGDFPSPFKYDVPGLRDWEGHIEAAYRQACGLPPNWAPVWNKVKRYDLMALHFEARELMLHPAEWIDHEMADQVPDYLKIRCHEWRTAASLFRSRAMELGLEGY